jgi:hypothetical protein
MVRPLYQRRVAEGAMLGRFLYMFTGDDPNGDFRQGKPFDGGYVARQEEAAARRLIWC